MTKWSKNDPQASKLLQKWSPGFKIEAKKHPKGGTLSTKCFKVVQNSSKNFQHKSYMPISLKTWLYEVKDPQPYDKGSHTGLLGPGPRNNSSTMCRSLLKSHRPCAKKVAGDIQIHRYDTRRNLSTCMICCFSELKTCTNTMSHTNDKTIRNHLATSVS